MPLSQPAERTHLHTREVRCEGFRRADGLWDIEAHLCDTKTFGFDNRYRGGRIEAGEPVHGMSLRVTLDLDMRIHAAEASSDFTPFAVCTSAADQMQKLVGLSIGPGWMRQVRERIGSECGCTHLIEMLGPLATTAYQTMHKALEDREEAKPSRAKPRIIDTCVALAGDGEIVRENWPEFYTGSADRKAG